MQVQYFMTPNPTSVGPDETVGAAWDRMTTLEVHHLPVTADGRLVGILSDRDLPEHDTVLVRDIMSLDPITVRPDDELIEAGRILLSNGINAVPVVDDDTALIGILTTTNCLVAMIQLNHELRMATS